MANISNQINVDVEVRPSVVNGIAIAVWRVRVASWLIALAERIGSCRVTMDVRLK